MNPYTLSCVHAGNLGVYRLALAAAKQPSELAMLSRLIRMEVTLVDEADDLLDEISRLRSAQRALSRQPQPGSGSLRNRRG